jgi:DNA methylase/ParB-like nuclease domain
LAQNKTASLTNSTRIEIEYAQVQQLKPDANNPRKHSDRQIKALTKSIKAFGFNIPIAVNANNQVIAGHARLEAVKRMGMSEVPVLRLDHLSDEQAKAFLIADNRLSEMSEWNGALLAVHLKELSVLNLDFDLEATGFTMGEIDLHIEGLDHKEDQDDSPPMPPQGPPVTQPGDLWLLGSHRLLCGNAQSPVDFDTLMAGRHAGMVISDPPFNVRVDGHVGGKGKIKHREFGMASGEMSEAEFTAFLQKTFELMCHHSVDGSIHTIFMDWRHLNEILAAGNASYTEFLNLCVWAKHQAGMGSLYRSQHELALIFKNGKAPHQNNIQLGRFGRYRTNIWQYPGIQSMRKGEEGDLLALHPTVKPVRMIAEAILDVSKRGDIVLDPFLGSGTTLLAAERVGRICYAMELDPLYVDTAIRRWQLVTGMDAVSSVNGMSFAQREAVSQTSVEVEVL